MRHSGIAEGGQAGRPGARTVTDPTDRRPGFGHTPTQPRLSGTDRQRDRSRAMRSRVLPLVAVGGALLAGPAAAATTDTATKSVHEGRGTPRLQIFPPGQAE